MQITVVKTYLRLLNQVFELERKTARLADAESVRRQVRRMKELFDEDLHLTYEDPTGQPFSETRTDVEARIAGNASDNLIIIETLKPVIRFSDGPTSTIVQKGVVVAGQLSQPSTLSSSIP